VGREPAGTAHQRGGGAPALVRRCAGRQEQPGPGRRGHRRGDHQLGVVAQAGPLARPRPLPVEDELAVAVVLHEGGDGPGDGGAALAADHQVAGLPAASAPDRAGLLEGGEAAVAQKRRAAVVERVPGARRHIRDGADHARRAHRRRPPLTGPLAIAVGPGVSFAVSSRTSMPSSPETLRQIEDLVKSDRVVLFMKGSRSFPQCGFSATVVQILNSIVPQYKTVNVLADPAVRQGIKDYSSWPTIPQLYIEGE